MFLIFGYRMRRWNGWGDESNSMDLPDSAGVFLQNILGSG